MPEHKYTNHLAEETSPYLLQHAHNPVEWYPWGREALKKAEDEDKLIFISIGYSTCHWCHFDVLPLDGRCSLIPSMQRQLYSYIA